MPSSLSLRRVYDVAVDRRSLQAGRLFRDGLRYKVALAGEIDARWAHAFRVLRIEDPDSCGFELDDGSLTVSFACANGRAAEVLAALDVLDSFVAMINENANELPSGAPHTPVIILSEAKDL